jgi:hypothetical protein
LPGLLVRQIEDILGKRMRWRTYAAAAQALVPHLKAALGGELPAD